MSIIAVLIAQACDVGYKPLVDENVPALHVERLKYVARHYIRPETLIAANALIVDYHANLPLAIEWGGGEVAYTAAPSRYEPHSARASPPPTPGKPHVLDDLSRNVTPPREVPQTLETRQRDHQREHVLAGASVRASPRHIIDGRGHQREFPCRDQPPKPRINRPLNRRHRPKPSRRHGPSCGRRYPLRHDPDQARPAVCAERIGSPGFRSS